MLMPPWHQVFLGSHCDCPKVSVLQEAPRFFFIHFVTGDLSANERISPQVSVDHRAEVGPRFAQLICIWGHFALVS